MGYVKDGSGFRIDLDALPEDVCRPRGALELDTRSIAPGELREWRHGLMATPEEARPTLEGGGGRPYPTQPQMGVRFGVGVGTWCAWEIHGVDDGPLCAALREHIAYGTVFDHAPTPATWFKAVAFAAGGYDALCDELRLTRGRARFWASNGVTTQKACSALIRWLFVDMGLEPLEEMPRGGRHDPEKIRAIRRRVAQGERQRDIAAELDVDQGQISRIMQGKHYGWV